MPDGGALAQALLEESHGKAADEHGHKQDGDQDEPSLRCRTGLDGSTHQPSTRPRNTAVRTVLRTASFDVVG